MLGVMNFVEMAGRSLGKMFRGKDATDRLKKEVEDMGLEHEEVEIDVDSDGTVNVSGSVKSQEEKEKILLTVGNVKGVKSVQDNLETQVEGPVSQFHTVQSGDTLWKISKTYYGEGSRYNEIFEANRPMLSDPDKIYVGQVLRIPVDEDISDPELAQG